MRAKLLLTSPTLCNPMDYSPPCYSVQGIFQARTLQWVAISSSRGSSRPEIEFTSFTSPALAGRFFFFFFLVLPVYCYQPISLHPRAHMLSHVITWTSTRQTPLSMDFSRQEYWSGLPFPSPGRQVLYH